MKEHLVQSRGAAVLHCGAEPWDGNVGLAFTQGAAGGVCVALELLSSE